MNKTFDQIYISCNKINCYLYLACNNIKRILKYIIDWIDLQYYIVSDNWDHQ